MRPERIPLVGPLLAAGPDDRIFDALLVLGPLVIAAVALLGRSAATVGLAVGYLLAVVAAVGARALA